jgi:dihydrofolate synthase/folylpolyglutamate synthase
VVSRSPLIVLDSAHNPHSMRALTSTLASLGATGALTFVFGCMADKQTGEMLAALMPITKRLILTQSANPRAAAAADLLASASEQAETARHRGEEWAQTIRLEMQPDIPTALTSALNGLAQDAVLCVAGSLAVAGEARTHLITRKNES